VEDRAPSVEQDGSRLSERARPRARPNAKGSPEKAFTDAAKTLSETYTLAYIQHTPMEPRAGVAEWSDGKLTVWAGCDGPYRAKGDLAQTFGLASDQVRVIIPDMAGGSAASTAPCGDRSARLAKARVGVCVRWTRAEEFTWAYFDRRPLSSARAAWTPTAPRRMGLTNINAGGAAIDTPYNVSNTRIASVGSDSPLAQGAYRCLALRATTCTRVVHG